MKTKKIVSLLLTVLMACSVFAGLSVSAEDTTHTYTAVGEAAFLGENWKPAKAENDLVLQSDGTYKIPYTGVAKSDCYQIKVAEDHDWTNSFGAAFSFVCSLGLAAPRISTRILDICSAFASIAARTNSLSYNEPRQFTNTGV